MTGSAIAAREAFVQRYGRPPAGVWSAPGRVNLIGEHTDYNQGLVLPFAIDQRTAVALAPREDDRARVSSDTESETVEAALTAVGPGWARGWSAYPLGTVWGLGEVGAPLTAVPGFDAHFSSNVPVGAGLSSSAAIECALAVALADVWGLDLDRSALVRATHLAENRVVGAPTGTLDQSASLLARAGTALFIDCRDGSSQPVPLDLAGEGLTILVIDTRVAHAHASGGYAARRASCEAGARALGVASLREVTVDDLPRARGLLYDETFRRVRHVVTENQRVLDTVAMLRSQGPAGIGPLLLASHASLRDDFEVTVPELDIAVEAAMAGGALGARMTGGGFGGAAIALVAERDAGSVARMVRAAFDERGFRDPVIFPVRPSAGARRDS